MSSNPDEFELNTIKFNQTSENENQNDDILTNKVENQDSNDHIKTTKHSVDRVNTSEEIETAYKSIRNEALPLAVAVPIQFLKNSELTQTMIDLKNRDEKTTQNKTEKRAFKSKKYHGML